MSDTPPTTEELEDAVRANALAPSSASNDRESASQHPLKDQLAVAARAKRQELDQGRGKGRTIRMAKVIPPGAL